MKYYLFRHGETYFSKHNTLYNDHNETAEILPEGVKQAKKLGEYFKQKSIDAYYSSPFLRCKQTVEIISQITGKPFSYDPRLGEEGITYGHETLKELIDRLQTFLEEIKTKNFNSVAICSHGWPIAIMAALVKKGKAGKSDLADYPMAGGLVEIEAN